MDQQERPSDEMLINKAVKGDKSSFEALYCRYVDPIYRYIFFRVNHPLQTEDMTEEVFTRALEALPTLRTGQYTFRNWLYRTAHNLVVDYFRKHKPVQVPSDQLRWVKSADEQPENIVDHNLKVERVAEAIRKLDETGKQVLILRFMEGLSHQDISSILGKSQAACRAIQYRALKTLRALLAEKEAPHG